MNELMRNLDRRDFLRTVISGAAGAAVAVVVPSATPVLADAPAPKPKRGSDPTLWHTKDDRYIPISEMENDHLLNAINFLYIRLDNLVDVSKSVGNRQPTRRRDIWNPQLEHLVAEARLRDLMP